MRLSVFSLSLGVLTIPAALVAQLPSGSPSSSPYFFNVAAPFDSVDGAAYGAPAAAGALGQVEPSAYADRYLTRLSFGGSVSTLGTGGELATNLPYKLDLRIIGNFTDFDWRETRSGFYLVANIGMANTGALVDFYPWKSLRISPGFLYYNGDRIRVDFQASPDATITINNVTYISDNANPVHGIGRLTLGGAGFMATAGWGHFVSRNEKRWSYPIEAGVALIHKPTALFSLQGDFCTSQGAGCRPAATFPGFASNLAAQLATWDADAAPYHVYPLVKAGVAYTFGFRP